MYGSSRAIASFALGCEEPLQIYEKWREALAKPMDPIATASSPVQDQVYTGKALSDSG